MHGAGRRRHPAERSGMLYSGLARQGSSAPLIEREGDRARPAPRRLLDPVAAWYVGNDPDRRAAADERAAWPHRVQDRHLLRLSRRLGGRLRRPHDRRRLGRAAGRRAGARTGRPRRRRADFVRCLRALQALRPAALPRAPKGVIFAATAKLPPPLQRFGPAAAPGAPPEPPRIMFPPDGARIDWRRAARTSRSRSRSPVAARRSPSWSTACRSRADGGRRMLFFQPDGPGFVRLTVMDARGAADSVMVRVQ